MPNPYYFADRTLRVEFDINLDRHHIISTMLIEK